MSKPHINIPSEGASSDRWCVNYDGLSKGKCKAGVLYKNVEVQAPHTYSHGKDRHRYDKPHAHPCFKYEHGLTKGCEQCRFPTEEEIKERHEKMMNHFMKTTVARAAIIKAIGPKWGGRGKMPCPVCETGELRYSQAECNGHVHAACTTETCVRWME